MSYNSTHHLQSDINSDILLPLPPEASTMKLNPDSAHDMEIYSSFMRHLRHVPNSRMEIKVLSSIQFTADMLDMSDAHVAKVMVDMGLRAPRAAFPADFLKYADSALLRTGWDIGSPSEGLQELEAYWNRIGEDRYSVFRRQMARIERGVAVVNS